MRMFSLGFMKPRRAVSGKTREFQDLYTGYDLTLMSHIKPNQYIYSNDTAFIDDGKEGQIIPSIYNATSECELMSKVEGILKSYGTGGIRPYIGFVSAKALGWNEQPVLLYDEGNECNIITGSWVSGYSKSTGGSAKNETNLYLYAVGNYNDQSEAEWTFVTDKSINLSRIRTLYFDCEKTGSSDDGASFRFVVSTEKMGSSKQYDARVSSNAVVRKILSLDVSSLTGEYYIRLHSWTGSPHDTKYMKGYVYKVWAE